MGCSSSTVARGGVDMSALPAPARPERRHSLPSRAASAMGSLGLCRGRHDGLHPYTTLPLEETVRGEAQYGAPSAEAKAASFSGDAAAWPAEGRAPMKLSPAGILEGAASSTSSTAHWTASATSSTPQFSASPSWFRGESSSSLPPPVQFVAPDFDPAILSLFREALVGQSPSHPAVLFPENEATTPRETAALDEVVPPATRDMPEVTGLVRARVDEFHRKLEEKKEMKEAEAQSATHDAADEVAVPPPRKAVVVYFTSIRGVRKTFADGAAVRAILFSYRVRVDERDVSMHAAFKDELRNLVGLAAGAGHVLPRVFVLGDGEQQLDLGGADEVSELHESGELAHALAGCETVAAHLPPCVGCGDLRFLPCGTCSGSCKLFAGDEGGCVADMFEECTECNENGLIRCPVCCL
ncbi:unnamed protein product [Triticum turgidum subsp. durum]|uniref:Glutaredoxin domain-containing protein n=1 Tax=Triticum turgidum subsp. durum TaxID=4567 RepID=A0A9R1S5R7_TRITD|nr:unnamed protein product [Triticum turgidum subsp. durum]